MNREERALHARPQAMLGDVVEDEREATVESNSEDTVRGEAAEERLDR